MESNGNGNKSYVPGPFPFSVVDGTHISGPPVNPGGLSSAYGATLFGRGGGPEDTVRQSLKANEIQMPQVAGTTATSVKPQDHLTQIVGGFLNGIIEHIVQRVVHELEPKLVDAWMLSVMDHKLRQEKAAQQPIPHPFEQLTERELYRRYCEHGSEGVCNLFELQKEATKLGTGRVFTGFQLSPVARRDKRPQYGNECGFRFAVDRRLFEIYAWRSTIEITEITTDDHKHAQGSYEAILSLLTLLCDGKTLDQAMEESSYVFSDLLDE